jgi:hypothetical protein
MMGLLSSDFEDPRTQGILALGLGLLGGRGNFGQALAQAGGQGIGAYQGARQNAAANELRKLQMAQMGLSMKASQQDIDQRERLAQLEAARRDAMSRSLIPGAALPLPATMDNRDVGLPGEQSLSRPGSLDMLAYANRLAEMGDHSALQVFASLQKDQPKPFTRKRDEDLLVPDGQGGVRVLMQGEAPPQKVDQPTSVQEYQFAVSQGFRGSFHDWDIARRRAGAAQGGVSYSAPVVGIDPATGQPAFFRPDSSGGMLPTGVQAPPSGDGGKVPAEIQRMNIAASTMKTLLNDYESRLKQFNPRDPMVQANPAVRAEFQSLMKNIQLQFKELQALGALAGPDLAIMEASITDPFTFKGAYYGRDGLQGQIRQARNLIEERVKNSAAATARPSPTPPGRVVDFGALK